MAFINEELTDEQMKEFNSWEIEYPYYCDGFFLGMEKKINPWYWTADKERNIYLLGEYTNRGYLDELVFIFLWNKKTYTVQFHKKVEVNKVIWSKPEHYFHKDLSFPYSTEENFLDDLREALLTYGLDGTTGKLNKKCESVICEF